MSGTALISIIVPIHNGAFWIDQCFESIFQQELSPDFQIEICICDDASTDRSLLLLENWRPVLNKHNIQMNIFKNDSQYPGGVGYSKNRAIDVSNGEYLCFQDIDDVMLPNRIIEQYNAAKHLPNNYIIGSQFKRVPELSTKRYAEWANTLPQSQLNLQVFTSHGPTVIMPTWFCHRAVFQKFGGFSEKGKGTPEDLIFFYQHLDHEGQLYRVEKCLLIYTYHELATTFSIEESTIWNIRLERLERTVLNNWEYFTIWNGGKQGRKLFRSLSKTNKTKVLAFCDVDDHKIGNKYISFDPNTKTTDIPIPIVHFREAKAPFIICVKINLTNGEFEKNLKSLKLRENIDYILFS